MKAQIVIKDGKSFKSVDLPGLDPQTGFDVTAMFYQAFVEKNDLAAVVVSELWPAIAAKYGEIDRIEITGYDVTRQIAGESVTFTQDATVSNLNLVKMLSGVAEWQEAKRDVASKFANVKAMLKQAVTFTTHGYEAGKRGRHAKQGMNQNQALDAARKSLGLA